MTTAVLETPVQAPAQADQVRQLALSELRIAPWNARKTFDPASLAELSSSIKAHGVQVPLLARPYVKRYYVQGCSFESLKDSKVRYAVCKNIIGRENIQQSFTTCTAEENQALAEKWCAEQNGPGDYEIVAGHRRFAALQQLKASHAPVIVRAMTDDQAREIGLVDNLQREDVPALEEADAYEELKKRLGTAAAIALRVGKDVAYVTRRLQLVSLGELPRKALAERLMSIDHALLLARLGADEQEVNLKWLLNPNAGVKTTVEAVIAERIKDRDSKVWGGYWEPKSVLELKDHIERNVGRKLSRAPWDLKDARLAADAAACEGCPSNTKANRALFSDLDIDEATCEDGGCFEDKRKAFVQIKLSEATHKQGDQVYGPAIRLSWKETSVEPRKLAAKAGEVVVDPSGFNLFQTFRAGQWVEAKPKSCANVRIGVTVDWSDDAHRGFMHGSNKLHKPGELLHVCISPKCKAHPKAYEKAKQRHQREQGDPAAEAAAKEKRKQEAIAESKLRMAVASQALEKITGLPLEAVRALALAQIPGWEETRRPYNALIPGIRKVLETAKADSPEFAKAVAVASLVNLTANEWRSAKDGRGEFLASVKCLGHDGSAAWIEAKKQQAKADKPAPAAKPSKAKKSILSAEAKKRIAAAQKKRWAKQKKGGAK